MAIRQTYKYHAGPLPDEPGPLGVYLKQELDHIATSINAGTETVGSDNKDYEILKHRPVWGDIVTPIGATRDGAAAPTLRQVGTSGLYLPDFDEDDLVHFTIHIPHDMKKLTGTDDTGYGGVNNDSPSFSVHWLNGTAGSSNFVKWELKYLIARGYSKTAFTSGATLNSGDIAVSTTQYMHHTTADTAMKLDTGSGELEPDAVILCTLKRIAPSGTSYGDANDIFVTHINLHYQKDKVGTVERERASTTVGHTSGGF
jgi:hypothetical protein|tara:strand:+ start:7359 stop:8129 length:771 start_codon:yes stop_codon:yes gene_type:complete